MFVQILEYQAPLHNFKDPPRRLSSDDFVGTPSLSLDNSLLTTVRFEFTFIIIY